MMDQEGPQDRLPPMMPGVALRAELDRRGWTQDDLAKILGRPRPTINEIILGKKSITPEMAVALGRAFGNGAEFWMGLESKYRLALVPDEGSDIARRARLYEIAPVKEMEKRQWIAKSTDPATLERELCKFFGVTSLDQEPQLGVATRKTDAESPLSPAQRAWCFRAYQMSKAVAAGAFGRDRLPECEKRLRQLAAFPEETRRVAKVLADFGIRFVVVEPLSGSKIDGAAFWLDPASPVIAMSVRFDRIDAFWFTLMHEFSHVRHGDALSIDTDLAGDTQVPSAMKSDMERRADEEAAASLVPPAELDSFVVRVGPLYAKARIVQFAIRMKIHPGIVVGQLQHRGEIGYQANRDALVKVREIVTSTALTDGWGRAITPGSV